MISLTTAMWLILRMIIRMSCVDCDNKFLKRCSVDGATARVRNPYIQVTQHCATYRISRRLIPSAWFPPAYTYTYGIYRVYRCMDWCLHCMTKHTNTIMLQNYDTTTLQHYNTTTHNTITLQHHGQSVCIKRTVVCQRLLSVLSCPVLSYPIKSSS